MIDYAFFGFSMIKYAHTHTHTHACTHTYIHTYKHIQNTHTHACMHTHNFNNNMIPISNLSYSTTLSIIFFNF